MKEITKYICGTCGREYKDKKECLKCEGKHSVPKKIHDWNFTLYERYPTFIYVQMSNGEVVTYEIAGKLLIGKEV